MKSVIQILVFSFFLLPAVKAQPYKFRIENVGIDVKDNKVIINYDLLSKSDSPHSVRLNFIDESFNVINPVSLSGDIGSAVSPGDKKSIQWDISTDLASLDKEIRPNVIVDGYNSLGYNGAGPWSALASVAIPGLGDYLVSQSRDLKFKPYMRTASVYGLLGLGFIAMDKRWKEPDLYTTVGTTGRHEQLTGTESRIYAVGETHYWIFKGDAEFFFGSAALIWAADIIWVAARGNVNQKLKNKMPTFTVGYLPGGVDASFSFRF